ncbi:MAG: rhodanese-like domain-containing protein [Actinomycetota bacterium]|nr:rhodanese-like domain-containing protein [Actinomycetota bacterium]
MTEPLTLAEVLAAARARLERVTPADLQAEVDAGALLIDVRDTSQRQRDGDLPGAHPIDLTILEWRLAPSSETKAFDVRDGQRVILVCNQGFSSSLAAARLQDLGVAGATDLEGGFTAWKSWAESKTRS